MAATDVVTRDEAKAALNITTTDFDAELDAYISAVSGSLDKLVGPIVKRTVNETRDGGDRSIWLYEYPIVSITSVTEYDDLTQRILVAESNTAKSANDYAIVLRSGQLKRRSSNMPWRFPCGAGNIVIVYEAGRYADTAAVDARFKLAANLMLANLWRVEQGQGTATFGAAIEPVFGSTFFIPNRVREILQNDLRPPVVR